MNVKVPKCSFCNDDAIISLPYARLNLCRKHLEEFILKRIKKSGYFSKVVLGLTGGKDSLSLAYALKRLGVDILAVTVDSVPEFTSLEARVASDFSNLLGVKHLKVYAYELYNFNTLNYKELRRKPCGLCSEIRNHYLTLIGMRTKRAVVTAHNMDDLLQVGVASLFTNRLENLRKITPVEEGAVAKWKPFIYLMERDILAFALTLNFPFIRVRCPLYEVYTTLNDKVKRFLNMLEEEHPSIKLSLLRSLIQFRIRKEEPISLKRCKFCGVPTYDEICGVCKIRLKGRQPRREPLKPVFKLYNTPTDGNVLILGHGEAAWVRAPKRFVVREFLRRLDLSTEEAVVTVGGKPVPYSAFVAGPWRHGEIVVHLITRVPLPKFY